MLKVENLTVRYSRSLRPAVDRVSLEVGDGEVVCVVGESGSGKSTLALACLRLLGGGAGVEGKVDLNGRDLFALPDGELRKVRGREIGFVNQDALSSFSAYWTVGEQISETIRAHTGDSRTAAWRRTLEQLANVKVRNPERIARSYPHELSGGQRQRAALAMALALRPRLLVADEPTSALDVTTAAHLLALLRQLQREQNIGVLLITHDLRVVEAVADRVAVMYAGVLGEVGATRDVLKQPRYPYTKALIDSLDLERARGELQGVRGTPPGLSEKIAGCPFAPRCPRAEAVCSSAPPPPVKVGGSVVRCHFPYADQEAAGRVHAVG
jgi:oligopeptide/dipeptide ABC transporter ATP-binding protein